jgi:primosomal protein N' (replication factor Y) (superfamily II helicase)
MIKNEPEFWSVAVEAPMPQPLTYSNTIDGEVRIQKGHRVEVPLGKRKSFGVVLGPSDEKSASESKFKIKSINHLVAEYPPLPDKFLKWLEWVAKYYIYPPGLVTSLSYPPLKKQLKERKSKRPPVVKTFEQTSPPELTLEQKKVVKDISERAGFTAHLLFGVTGSGKTEVYLRLLEKNLSENKTGLVLVPEISLTPQLLNRFSSRFGDQVAVLHSQLTDRERTQQWWDVIEGRKKILVGARSAIFCPIENLGIIIIDEEHEASFKQEEKLKYSGRDAAIALAQFQGCPIILGSATPSLESWKNAKDGKYKLHEMKNRVGFRAMPNFEIIDLKHEKKNRDPLSNLPSWMSEKLFSELQQTLEKKEQAALFLNRRGIASLISCKDCGHVIECPNCDISLTLHGRHDLVCHYCDYHQSLPEMCPDCHVGEITPLGLGTESIEIDLKNLFPNARVARADRDEIQNREELENLISQMESSEIDILVGTQMIAKGLDFPNLNLVGLVLADVGFNLPDFRATERSFQLITQVAGRAGRHIKENAEAGKVIVQTYNPEHPALKYAIHHNYVEFADEELAARAELNYPPCGKLVSLRLQSTQLTKVQQACAILKSRCVQLRENHQSLYKNISVLGPAEAPIAKLRGQYRFHLLIKGPDPQTTNAFTRQVLGDETWLPKPVRVLADVDPLSLL